MAGIANCWCQEDFALKIVSYIRLHVIWTETNFLNSVFSAFFPKNSFRKPFCFVCWPYFIKEKKRLTILWKQNNGQLWSHGESWSTSRYSRLHSLWQLEITMMNWIESTFTFFWVTVICIRSFTESDRERRFKSGSQWSVHRLWMTPSSGRIGRRWRRFEFSTNLLKSCIFSPG